MKKQEDFNYDIRNILLSKEIDSYNSFNKLTQKDVFDEIEKLFNKSIDTNIKTEVAEKII